jgi:hypothetical protein
MGRKKGFKLSQEQKDLLREKALAYRDKIKELKENDRETNRTSDNENAGENDNAEIHISERQTDNRKSGETETLEIEKGALKTMEIPPKKPLEIEEHEATPEKFTCANCQGELTMGTKFCPHCGCQLDWSIAS